MARLESSLPTLSEVWHLAPLELGAARSASLITAYRAGSLPGIYIGSHLAARIADRFLLPALASMLMLLGLRLIAL